MKGASEAQIERTQHAHRLRHDLGADAVTRQDCDLHESISFFLSIETRSTSTFSHTLNTT